MTAPVPISLEVNGERVDAQVLPRLNLADFLREHLQLTGTHVGCEHGVCGACTVRVNGEIVRSCLMLAVQAHGASVETIEGLSDSGEIADLQAAFRDRNALQCGYCTPGMLMAAQDLLKQQAEPDREQIREHLSGNYCRCTGYQAIIDAVETTARARRGRTAMTIAPANPEGLSVLDRPNSYIGKTVPRPNLERLMQGRGLYVSDMELPRMAHVVFLRSPHAHAKIVGIDAAAAKRMPGVIAVVTGEELAAVITPWVGVLSHLKGLKSAPQHAIAIDRVCWQGEAVAAIVATSRAVAEDAAEIVAVEYEELEAVTDMRTALDPETPVIHPSLGDNLAFERNLDAGAVDEAFAGSDEVVEAEFIFGRHTGVTLEPRAVRGRLERRRGAADDLSGHAGAAHGAEHRRAASRACRNRRFAWSARTSAAPSASRSTSMPTRWRPMRCRNCCAGRSNSSPTGSKASIPTSTPATIAARGGSASSATAPSRRSRSTISPASVPIRCIRAPARSRPTRSSIWSAAPM